MVPGRIYNTYLTLPLGCIFGSSLFGVIGGVLVADVVGTVTLTGGVGAAVTIGFTLSLLPFTCRKKNTEET